MLTLERLLQHVTDALERAPSSTNSIELLVNEAGVAWCNLASWSYLRRQKLALPLVVDQTVYPLGPALREIQTIADPSFPNWRGALMPRADFDVWKVETRSPAISLWRACLYLDVVANVRQRVLEMWPAPSIERTLSLIYTRGWAAVDKLTDSVDLPVELEPAFIAWVRNFALGREKKMGFEEALEMAKASSLVRDAIATEGRDNPSLPPEMGRIGEGYAQRVLGTSSLYTSSPWGPRLRYPWGNV